MLSVQCGIRKRPEKGAFNNTESGIIMEPENADEQDKIAMCCVCPFCPVDWPCCFINRKAAMQHQRAEKTKHNPSDWDAKMPDDSDLEWAQCVLTVYEKKMRWVRVEFVEKKMFQQLNEVGGFRLKSIFERKRNLLAIHASPPEGLFEMGAISATMRYFEDAKQLVLRIKYSTLKAR